MKILRFDQALPAAFDILQQQFGDRTTEITFVRDSLGAVTVVLPDEAIADPSGWNELAAKLDAALGAYSPGASQILLRVSDLIDPSDVLESPDRVPLSEAPNAWLVDRLLTNQDWLREPLVKRPPIPTAVAFSIKGGVGRTTTLALWAWYLARQGKNVVLVDLDLEAPGLGSLVLDLLPDHGLLDWLMESLVGQADESLLRECLIDCPLARDEPGTISILPASGSKTVDYVGKLGRIYMPTLGTNQRFVGLADRLGTLLVRLADSSYRPDVILLDCRAGLHDIGAAAVTRLGAEVFLFARNESQSWLAYRQLFDHLRRARSVTLGMPDDDLRWRLKMVAAQLDPTEHARAAFLDASYETWTVLYDEGVSAQEEEEKRRRSESVPSTFSREDSHAPHFPLVVEFDPRVRNFNLTDSTLRPDWRVIENSFGDFFADATARLGIGYE